MKSPTYQAGKQEVPLHYFEKKQRLQPVIRMHPSPVSVPLHNLPQKYIYSFLLHIYFHSGTLAPLEIINRGKLALFDVEDSGFAQLLPASLRASKSATINVACVTRLLVQPDDIR